MIEFFDDDYCRASRKRLRWRWMRKKAGGGVSARKVHSFVHTRVEALSYFTEKTFFTDYSTEQLVRDEL